MSAPEDSTPTSSEAAAPQLPLPSVSGLVKATSVALGLALLLLVVVILPAEYQIDPTGVGAALGLTRLSAESTAAVESEPMAPGEAGEEGQREDSVIVEVPAGKGLEYKFQLEEGEKLSFHWTSDVGAIYHDFHGEPAGDTTGFFESYSATTASEVKGILTAPFDGSHGWYWENSSTTPARISLKTSGTYVVLGLR